MSSEKPRMEWQSLLTAGIEFSRLNNDSQVWQSISMNASNAAIYILGPNSLQNELLVNFLQQESAITAEVASIPPPKDPAALFNTPPASSLALLDCYQQTDLQCWSNLISHRRRKTSPDHRMALFNILPDHNIERLAVEKGLAGVLYATDPLSIFAKGVQEMLNGELWYSRKTMSRFLKEKQNTTAISQTAADTLTLREREILIAIATGASNKEIAYELNISLHTVKTHIYNIYRKIKVPNRLQAAFWAAHYL